MILTDSHLSKAVEVFMLSLYLLENIKMKKCVGIDQNIKFQLISFYIAFPTSVTNNRFGENSTDIGDMYDI